jgi:D-glycero-D-manno-heptose 1,7-bisphosphate phosphatase
LNKKVYSKNSKVGEMKKAIFLDRDGVINKLVFREGKAQAPYLLEEFELYEGVIEALKIIKAHGYLAIIVTNQPDVARGWVAKESVEMINNKILELLPIDDIKICFHTNDHNCQCRKPMPGMLIEAAKDWGIDLLNSFMIGDRFGDVAAGKAAGCKTILIGAGDEQGVHPNPDFRASLLIEATKFINLKKV